MTTPVTEICYITLKPGLDIDGDTDAAQVLKSSLKTASEQVGFQRHYFGKQFEHPDVVMVLIDWDSLDSKSGFTTSPFFATFIENLLSIAAALHYHHTQTIPFPALLLAKAPCIEFVTMFGCTPTFFSEHLQVFSKAVEEGGVEGFHGAVLGEVVESVAKGGADEGKGRAVTLWFGWDSKEAHMKFRESKLFADNIGLLRTGCEGSDMFHINFKTEC